MSSEHRKKQAAKDADDARVSREAMLADLRKSAETFAATLIEAATRADKALIALASSVEEDFSEAIDRQIASSLVVIRRLLVDLDADGCLALAHLQDHDVHSEFLSQVADEYDDDDTRYIVASRLEAIDSVMSSLETAKRALLDLAARS